MARTFFSFIEDIRNLNIKNVNKEEKHYFKNCEIKRKSMKKQE